MSDYIIHIIPVAAFLIIVISFIYLQKYRSTEDYKVNLRANKVYQLYCYEKQYLDERNRPYYRSVLGSDYDGMVTYNLSDRIHQLENINKGNQLKYHLDLFKFIKYHHLQKLNVPKSPNIKMALEEQIKFLDEFIEKIFAIDPSLKLENIPGDQNHLKPNIQDYFIHSLSFEKFDSIVKNKIPQRKRNEPYKIHLGKFIYFLSREGYISFNI